MNKHHRAAEGRQPAPEFGALTVCVCRRTVRAGRQLTADARAHLTADAHAHFSCRISLVSLPLEPSELPHPPQNLLARLDPTHSHAVVLSWVRPFDGNSPVLRYIVELSENSE